MSMQMKAIPLHGSHRCAVPFLGIVSEYVQSASGESVDVQCKCNTQAGHSCKYQLIY